MRTEGDTGAETDTVLTDGPAPTGQDGAFAPAMPLRVRRLSLTDFRNYRTARIEAGDGPVVLTGLNGAGKTNLLEAISFLAPGRGLRRARLAAVERQRAGAESQGAGWAVNAQGTGPAGDFSIGTGRDPAAPADRDGQISDRRLVRIDGEPVKGQTALGDIVHMAWLTPEMDRLFLEGASDRRRFFDRLVYGFTPGHARQLSAYERAMRERSRLLRDGRFDPAWLGALEDTMAESGIAVADARRRFLSRLAAAVELGISAFPVPDLALDGDVEASLADQPATLVEEALRRTLAASRRRDAEAGRALHGVHRTDLAVRHRAKDMPAALCSTGEQKALLVAIVLATARLQKDARGSAPLLLLDEIAAHLDAGRRAALFDEICALGSQAWMTGTDPALFAALDGRARFLTVDDGEVRAAGATPKQQSESPA